MPRRPYSHYWQNKYLAPLDTEQEDIHRYNTNTEASDLLLERLKQFHNESDVIRQTVQIRKVLR